MKIPYPAHMCLFAVGIAILIVGVIVGAWFAVAGMCVALIGVVISLRKERRQSK